MYYILILKKSHQWPFLNLKRLLRPFVSVHALPRSFSLKNVNTIYLGNLKVWPLNSSRILSSNWNIWLVILGLQTLKNRNIWLCRYGKCWRLIDAIQCFVWRGALKTLFYFFDYYVPSRLFPDFGVY